MRKQLAIAVALFMLFALVSPSFASVGTKVDGVKRAVADINFSGTETGGAVTVDGSGLTFNLMLSGVGNGGATSMASSTLVVPVGYSFIKKVISSDAAFGAGTLADGVPGQILTLYIHTDQGSVDFVVTPATSLFFTTATFDSVGDTATFLWTDDTNGWAVIANTSVTVALVP